jgi:hypothetical protein
MAEPKNKIGIVCDNYKVKKFHAELDKAGFTYESFPNGKLFTLIKVNGDPSKQPKVHAICLNVEA